MSLFGTSGVRGVVDKDLTVQLCEDVAKAVGTTLPAGARVCLATDSRVSREILKEAIFSGLLSCGIEVIDLGILPTPALALLTREWEFDTGIMVTASHNPPEFNGIKLFNKDSSGYSKTQEQEIEKVYLKKEFRTCARGRLFCGGGMENEYLHFIENQLGKNGPNKNLRIVVDAGNGAASGFASYIFTKLGVQVFPINDVPDGRFPGRSPEPKEDTLQGTVKFLREKEADLAVCFDGDADRVVFCDRDGFIGFNESIAFISRLILGKNGKRKVATTVETGQLLDLAVRDMGAEVVRGRVGDVDVAHLARELDAAVGVEQVGVYIIPQAGYYPDSIFAALTLLSNINQASEIREFFKKIPELSFMKGKVPCPNELKERTMKGIEKRAHIFRPDHLNTIDGLRFEFEDSWMLIRASGTEPAIRILAESASVAKSSVLLEMGTHLVEQVAGGVK